jgi:protein-disulfide isomerase
MDRLQGGIPMKLAVALDASDHVKGGEGAKVTLVEYGDYECPFCKAAQPLVEALDQALGSNMRTVFRHFPVTNVHPHAERAAEAAEAAASQDKFWEMHELLYANQNTLDDASLLAYARSLELDEAAFRKELESGVYKERIRRDLQGGLQSGVRGTPTFFIDGEKYDGPPDLQGMLALIRQRHPDLSAATQTVTEQIRVPALTPHAP